MRLRKASRRMTQVYDRMLAPTGLTVTQYSLLAHLARLDGASIGTLAEVLVMDPTTLTRNVRPLARRGLLAIAPDPNDKRSRCLRLTGDGRRAFEHARPHWRRAQAHIEERLGGERAHVLDAGLDQVLERLAD
jgi:DNA-binding MarR family transcriptional regulator